MSGSKKLFNEFDLSKDWKTTRLDGDVLDYLGKLVTEGKLDPVWCFLQLCKELKECKSQSVTR